MRKNRLEWSRLVASLDKSDFENFSLSHRKATIEAEAGPVAAAVGREVVVVVVIGF